MSHRTAFNHENTEKHTVSSVSSPSFSNYQHATYVWQGQAYKSAGPDLSNLEQGKYFMLPTASCDISAAILLEQATQWKPKTDW